MRTAKSLEGEREGKAWGDPVEGCNDNPLLSWNCRWWWVYSGGGFQVKKLLFLEIEKSRKPIPAKHERPL
jgi:hypothetical protein